LIGGFGNATLMGGSGTTQFEYIVPTGTKTTKETIVTPSGKGTVWVGSGNTNVRLTGGDIVAGKTFTWAGGDGTQYQFSPSTPGLTIGSGTLVICARCFGLQCWQPDRYQQLRPEQS
jgi:hypothetical protein